jgi:photosystem II stability/assembly factor-like uncharacterized protein
VNQPSRFGLRLLFAAVVLFGFTSLFDGPAAMRAEEPTNAKEIADIEKQINDLTKKLDTLKNGKTPAPTPKAVENTLPDDWAKALNWRSIGPASMGGRITAISVYEADPSTWWIATASGGLVKTTNNGTTFEHQFDREATVSIGDVCVAPSDKNIVWVGTGENNPRNSVSYGDGVYKSTDGGKTWKNMGLKKTFQIGKVLVHPKNPDIVYVGALGRLYGPNEDRGLYKTSDGGKTWQKILYVDDKTGVIDMRMHPEDPETLLVATWERRRDEFDSHRGEPPLEDGYDAYDPIKKWGAGGIYKTTDGGHSFNKLTKGLPTCPLGRIGLDYYRKNPNVLFAIIDCQKIGSGPLTAWMGIQGSDVAGGAKLTAITKDAPSDKAGLKAGDIVKAFDKKDLANYAALAKAITAHKPNDKITLTIQRDKETMEIPVTLGDRGERPNSFMYGGQRENVQDKQGPDSHEYGGVYKSTDGGESWTRINSINPRPMYFSQVRVDPSDEKYVYVLGIRLYRSQDGGKSFKPDGANGVHDDQHALWIDPRDGRHMIVGCDGGFYATYDRMDHWEFLNTVAIGQFYHVAVDSNRLYKVYGGLQDNGSWGGPSRSLSGPGPINEDWIVVAGGDGFVCRVDANDPNVVYYESQDGNMGRRNVHTGEAGFLRPRDRQGASPYRFNWNTPFILSHHNSHIFYSAGNYVFSSLKQGEGQRVISPEISRTKRGTASALAESPRNAQILYVGTDDGFLWVSRDGGVKWTNITAKVPLPGPRWVATIEPSQHVDGRCYVVFDAHRSNDDEPYVFVTEDEGETWKPLRSNLPTGSTRVLREDIENPNLLYLGTEFSVYASTNRGQSWTKINNNLPTVAVHEFAQHPTAGELVAATHGRSIWILDVTALRRMTADALKAPATLYRPNTVVRWHNEPQRGSIYGVGSRLFVGENPPFGAQIYYSLTKKATKASVKILDYTGKTLRELPAKSELGLHRVTWDLIGESTRQRQPGGPGGGGGGRVGGGGAGGGGGPGGGGGRFGQQRLQLLAYASSPLLLALPQQQQQRGPQIRATPGMYRVVLTVDGQEHTQGLRIEADPTLPPPVVAVEEEIITPEEAKINRRRDDD